MSRTMKERTARFRMMKLFFLMMSAAAVLAGCSEAADITEAAVPIPAERESAEPETAEPEPSLSGTGGAAHRLFRSDAEALTREERQSGRSAAVTRDPLASEVGRAILSRGGNAADAAVAIGLAISIAEPQFSHALGGGTWALYYNADRDRVRALDGVGYSGSRVELDFFRDPGLNTPFGPHRVIVPGAWDGWMLMLRDEGSMHLDELLEPAIAMAANGIPASRSMVGFIIQERHNIRRYPDTAAVFLPEGEPPAIGDIIVQENSARTLRGLAAAYRNAYDGLEMAASLPSEEEEHLHRREAGIQAARDHYYRGPVAEELARFLENNGGFVTKDDFAGFEAQWLEPIYTMYRDTLVYGSPPNSQGASMLMALNILENLDLSAGPGDPDVIHRIVEATKLAKIDTWHYIADPDSMPLQVEQLLDKEYALQQAERIADDRVITWPEEGGVNLSEENNTTTFSVVDADGNAAAVTSSTGAQFLVGGKTGILLNQRMAIMEIAEGNPNIIAPNKKPRHTVNPYMAFRNGRFLIAGGNTGFDTQPQGQIQQFLNLVEFDMSAREAVSRKRFITHTFPASHHPHAATNELYLERGFPPDAAEELRSRGHTIGRSGIIGNANVIYRNPETDELEYGADPRGENSGFIISP